MLSHLIARVELRKLEHAARLAWARGRQRAGRTYRRESEPANLAFPRTEDAGPVVTVYAVALYYDPLPGRAAAPLMTLRQFIRSGDRPLSDNQAAYVAAREELHNWKADRPPVADYAGPVSVVCYRVVPVPADVSFPRAKGGA
jgi:hypothetical protein